MGPASGSRARGTEARRKLGNCLLLPQHMSVIKMCGVLSKIVFTLLWYMHAYIKTEAFNPLELHCNIHHCVLKLL